MEKKGPSHYGGGPEGETGWRVAPAYGATKLTLPVKRSPPGRREWNGG
jgi:hypothetical protein